LGASVNLSDYKSQVDFVLSHKASQHIFPSAKAERWGGLILANY
jgi:hypothetical protein